MPQAELLTTGHRRREVSDGSRQPRRAGTLETCTGRQIETRCAVAWPSLRGRPEVRGVESLLPWAKLVQRSCAQVAVAVHEQSGPTTTVPRPSKKLPTSSRDSAAAARNSLFGSVSQSRPAHGSRSGQAEEPARQPRILNQREVVEQTAESERGGRVPLGG